MKSQRNIARQILGLTLTLTLVGLMSWNTLPIHFPERTVQAATRARITEPTGQAVSRAAANGRIAFVSREVNAPSDIYTMNPDGSDRKQLTFSQEYEDQPVWSPDGTKIAFARVHWNGNDSYSEIFVMNADGSDQRRLTQSRFDGSPTWSPDGTKIAFWRIDSITMPSSWGIFVMNADGSDQRAVASTSDLQEPAWSPDGLKFAVIGIGALNSYSTYLINVDGSNRTQITQPPTSPVLFEDHVPAWSPDGSKITFIRCEDANGFGCWDTTSHLWVVNADGSNPTQLTDTQAWSHAWSPDGTKIIVGNAQYSGGDLLVMNPDGSGLTNITNTNDKHESSPSWQPLSLPPVVNPIDDPQFFVRQHYLDFLNREPDPNGLAYWTNQITSCPPGDQLCVNARRVAVSNAFFFEPEFQQSGGFVYRVYKAAFGLNPAFAQFQPDRAQVVGGANLDQSKTAFALDFVQRSAFVQAYPLTLTASQFVDQLLNVAQQDAGVNLSSLRTTLIGLYDGTNNGRAAILRQLADSPLFIDGDSQTSGEYNQTFVFSEYVGFLLRHPETDGFNFWLDQVNRYPKRDGDAQHAMVCSFVTSAEYQLRFGAAVTHTNAECPQ